MCVLKCKDGCLGDADAVFSLMQERRVLVVSRKLGRLTACIQAAASLIYPMFWYDTNLH